MGALGPWHIYRPVMPTLSAPTLALAKAKAGRVYPVGFVNIEHETSGEDHVREAGRWRCRREAKPGHLIEGAIDGIQGR